MIDNEALQSLERLHKLKEDGVITAEDFEAAKQRLLTQPVKAAKGAAVSTPIERPADDNHIGWMLLPLKRYADFTGRSSRKEFWMFMLAINLIVCGLAVFVMADTATYGYPGPIGTLTMGLIGIVFLGTVVPMLAVQARRFHDQGKSGWFTLLNLIPYIGWIVVLGFMLIQGVEGDNEFGPDPR